MSRRGDNMLNHLGSHLLQQGRDLGGNLMIELLIRFVGCSSQLMVPFQDD
jgi:hypothetical protein